MMRTDKRAYGMVLMTALTIVLIVFAAVTATVANVKFGQGMTSQSAQTSQAVFLGRAGLAYALNEVNAGAGWMAAHGSEGAAEVVSYPEGEFRIWIEPHPSAPGLFLLNAVAKTTGRTHRARLLVREESPELEGVLFSRFEQPGTDGLFYKRSSQQGWNTLEPPPMQWFDPGGALFPVLPDPTVYPDNLTDLEGNDEGILFARHERDLGEIDTLYRYDLAADDWSVLPPAPNVLYDAGGKNVAPLNTFATKLTSLASDGGDVLYARTDNSDATASDTIHKFNDSTDSWIALPPVPDVNFTSSGVMQGGTAFADSLAHLSADRTGNLYGVWNRAVGVDTIFKWNGTAWTAIEPPEKVTFDHSGKATAWGERADHLEEMAVAPNGDIYIRGVNPGDAPDTLYKHVDGTWTVVPPPPQIRLHKSQLQDSYELAKDYSEISVDRDGRVYLREKKGDGKPDVIYVYYDGEFSYLPAQEAAVYSGGTEVWMGGAMTNSTEDIGSGAMEVPGGKRYVPTMDF